VVVAKFIDVSNDTALCPRDTAHLRVTSANNVPIASVIWTPDLYLSNDTSFTPLAYPVVTTRYFVTGRDTNFCLDTGSVLVTIKPEAVILLPDSTRIYPGESYQMDPGGNCLYFNWFPPYGLSADTIANPVAKPEVNTRYFVDATTEFGCTTRDSIDVFVNVDSYVDMPNAFTPGSAPNAILYPSHRGLVSLKYFRVYNRWGVKVFESNDLAKGWDGTFNGEPQPMGVYVYVVEATTPTGRRFYKQGNITLIR
ncbi:MAG TPA: gliding motility-associated C-terminal domain-containing protein, partial [Fibrella sp.]